MSMMSGRGGVGREQRVGGGEEGVRELYAVVVKSMSEKKNDGWWEMKKREVKKKTHFRVLCPYGPNLRRASIQRL